MPELPEDTDLLTFRIFQNIERGWCWECYVYEGEPLAGGGGYQSEDEAHESAYKVMGVLC